MEHIKTLAEWIDDVKLSSGIKMAGAKPVFPIVRRRMMVATMLFDRRRLREMEMFETHPPQVHYSKGAHTGLAVSAFLSQNRNRSSSRKRLARLVVGKSSAEQVRRGRALPHHVFRSGWISFG